MEKSNLPEGFVEEHTVIYGVTPDGVFHIKLNNP
jgi:hypothetical protein